MMKPRAGPNRPCLPLSRGIGVLGNRKAGSGSPNRLLRLLIQGPALFACCNPLDIGCMKSFRSLTDLKLDLLTLLQGFVSIHLNG